MRYLLVLVFVTACGDDATTSHPDAANGGDDAPTQDTNEVVSCGTAGPAEMTCGSECVDTSSDPSHCGNCSTTCMGQMPACGAGSCVAANTTTWVKHFGGDDFGYSVTAIAVDGAGNTYFTGQFENTIDLGGDPLMSSGGLDIIVASFAPDGTHRWSRRFGATGSDQGAGITVAANKVYVTGAFSDSVNFGGGARTSAGFGDVFVLVLDASDGGYLDDRAYGGAGDDAGIGIVVDATGNITFGGFFSDGTITFAGTSLTTVAFIGFVASVSPAWAHRWSRRLGGNAAADISSLQSLAIDSAGNVALALNFEGMDDFGDGTVSSGGSNFDAVVASYTPDGAFRWKRKFGAAQGDTAEAVAVDADGNVLAGGGFHSMVDFGTGNRTAQGVIDGWVAMLEGANGATRWVRTIGSADSSAIHDLAFDPAGTAIIAASIEGTTDIGNGSLQVYDQYDILIAGMSKTNGDTDFANVYGGTDFEGASTIAVTNGGDGIAIGGYFRGTVELGTGTPVVGGAMDNGFAMMIAR